MSSAEETPTSPPTAPATEAPAADGQGQQQQQEQVEESMDSSPAPAPTQIPTAPAPVQEPAKTETVVKPDSAKFVKPASQPLIKPPVPKTIQNDRQSIEKMEEAKLKAKFGGLQKPGGSHFLQKRLNKGQMKYFDSGDYMMAKQTGKQKRPLSGKPGLPPAPKPTGEAIPTPDSIHHRKPSSEISKLAV